jgi:dipeptidase D
LLINIDSEKEGVFTIGCAGSKNLCLELPVEREPLPNGWPTATLTVTGLRGGHSGMNIAEGRGNANKILAEMLEGITAATEIRLLSLQGGTRANAIPRQAEAVIAFPPQAAATVQKRADQFAKKAAERFGTTEPELTVALVPGPRPQDAGQALDGGSTMQCLRLLAAIPHGVIRMDSDRPDTVATSNNLALVRIEQERMKVLCLPRSIRMEELDTFEKKMAGTAARFNARFSVDGRYPAWEPDPASLLLGHCLAVYRRTFGREAVLHVTHGGLECGIFSARLPGVELVSLGPDMENAHSPDERAFLPSIIKVQRFLKTLLESLG